MTEHNYVIPMVIEEPSVIAAVSAAAKTCQAGGGFHVTSDEPCLIGQVQIVGLKDPSRARRIVQDKADEIVNAANRLQPNMLARGGGVREVEALVPIPRPEEQEPRRQIYPSTIPRHCRAYRIGPSHWAFCYHRCPPSID